jgi:ABC-type lipoprotein release transport system permease subunit
VRVVGIEPEREPEITLVADSLTAGAYLDGDRHRVLLGDVLAQRLEVGIGDKVVLSVQNLEGDLTGEALRVGGLFHTPSRPLDSSTVFMRLDESQTLLGLDGAVSEIVVLAASRSRIPAVRALIEQRLAGVEVQTWEELQPVLVYIVDVFDQSAVMIYAAVFIAMAFGIANVLLMTIYERTREIGIMTAVGFSRSRLVATIVCEALIVTLVGVVLGFGASLLSVWLLEDGIDLSGFAGNLDAFGIGPRIVPVLRRADFSAPLGVAIVTALIASAWPAWRAVRLRPAEAVRHT